MRLPILLLTLALPLLSQGQTADDIVKRYLDKIDGSKKWKDVKSMITKGEYDYGGIVFPFTTYAKAPSQYKFVVPFNGKYYAQGYDGNSGWKIDAFKNETTPTLLNGSQARAMANEADVELEIPFINYKAKGHQIKLEGRDTLDGKQFYIITLLKSGGEKETYYFHSTTYSLYLKKSIAKNIELEKALLDT
ncbi:hypothetical protein [Pseudochryseolinea flava]|uniref:Outer membrane lipoprotein carrier protein LolA n=1 Tax=Pseudochryseolinea flava TaxID=2059302 RepID=A0A364Y4S2_9BACT|nr:hypothetical protein [Pseudochryseolinea flava]RAW01887.1 hypothetical protein DQQ10_09610 [Pseudochryseolinea flava]